MDFYLFAGLFSAALADLFFRYFAFGGLDSVAVDVALYTFLYSLTEVFRAHQSSYGRQQWDVKTGVGIAILILLVALHIVALRAAQQRRVQRRLNQIVDSSSRAQRETYRAAQQLIERVVPLSIEWTNRKLRTGKEEIRQEVAALLAEIARHSRTSPLGDLQADDFLLPRRTRAYLWFAFAMLGLGALVTPAISVAAMR